MYTKYQNARHLMENLQGKCRDEVRGLCHSERQAASGVLRDFLPSDERHRLERYERELWFLSQYLEFGRMLWVMFPGQESFGEIATEVSRMLLTSERTNKRLHPAEEDSRYAWQAAPLTA